jgi:hypothetical protein
MHRIQQKTAGTTPLRNLDDSRLLLQSAVPESMFCPMPSAPTKRRPWVPLIDESALQLALARKGWTQRDLVRECAQLGTKVDRGNLGRAVNGKRGSIGVRKLPVIAKALEVDVAELLTSRGKARQSTGQQS